MNKLIRNALVSFSAMALLAPAASAGGPEIFKAQKCDSCHSVSVAGISRAAVPDDDKAPDLSKVGGTLDKKAIASYLLKKSELNGAKHKKAFQGTTDELKEIATWLGGLK
ncbi:MAG: c-type cytochrome [Deltaproteobacteria bacterium]|nr:c-type cytochrome [Deltaproteobacteria bacterium]